MATKSKVSDIIDISLSPTKKKRFRIDGDDNRIIELNISDINIMSRLNDAYGKLTELASKASLGMTDIDTDTEEGINELIVHLKEIDTQMRELINFIFDSDIADVCAPDGSMYDPFNGEFRFDHIISTLITLYENNFDAEFKQMSKNVKKHTDKYVGKS